MVGILCIFLGFALLCYGAFSGVCLFIWRGTLKHELRDRTIAVLCLAVGAYLFGHGAGSW
jgi:hypothetical protein